MAEGLRHAATWRASIAGMPIALRKSMNRLMNSLTPYHV
jgi:hypothetical protein